MAPRTARRPPHRPPPLHRLSRPINRPLRCFLTTTTPTATSSLLPELPTPPPPTIAAEPRRPPRSCLLASPLPKVRGALGPPCSLPLFRQLRAATKLRSGAATVAVDRRRPPPWPSLHGPPLPKPRQGIGSSHFLLPFPPLPECRRAPRPPASGRRRRATPSPVSRERGGRRRAVLPLTPSPSFYFLKNPPPRFMFFSKEALLVFPI